MAISFRKPKVIFLTLFHLMVTGLCFYASYQAQSKGFGMVYFAALQLLMIANAVISWSNFVKWMEYQ